MTKLSDYRRDLKAVEEGVWIPFAAGIRLKIARYGNTRFQEFAVKHGKPFIGADLAEGSKDLEETVIHAVAHYILLDWENVEDDDGELIEYSSDIGFEYLNNPEYEELLLFIIRASKRNDIFRTKAIEEMAGNSPKSSSGD